MKFSSSLVLAAAGAVTVFGDGASAAALRGSRHSFQVVGNALEGINTNGFVAGSEKPIQLAHPGRANPNGNGSKASKRDSASTTQNGGHKNSFQIVGAAVDGVKTHQYTAGQGKPFQPAHTRMSNAKPDNVKVRRRRSGEHASRPSMAPREQLRDRKRALCTVQQTTTTYTTTTSTAPPTATVSVLKTATATATATATSTTTAAASAATYSSCFPALDFTMPSEAPANTTSNVANWWCNTNDEVAWLGFSFDLSACPDSRQLTKSFTRMRTNFNARYVRMYGTCDTPGYTDQLIDSAWEAGIGIYPLIWFGYDGSDQWKTRRDDIVSAIQSNPKAPFVVRGVVVGSEPMYDNVLSPADLAEQIISVKTQLSPWTSQGDTGMQVTLSEMPYGYSIREDSDDVFQAVDVIHAHSLPFFAWTTVNASSSASLVKNDIDYMQKNGYGKKIIISQTGWPSNTDVWKPNSQSVVASVSEEQAYYEMLDNMACSTFVKNVYPKGGVAWFSHIYTDLTLPGWGILDSSYKLKFPFSPKTSCS